MTEEGKQSLAGQAGRATGGMIVRMSKGLFNSKGRRPRIVAHTGGIPPISRMHYGQNLEGMKPKFLRGTDITGRRHKP